MRLSPGGVKDRSGCREKRRLRNAHHLTRSGPNNSV
jgi:hypothetical protein